MKTGLLTVALVLAIAASASAKNAKVYVFIEPQGPAGFAVVPEELKASGSDLLYGIGRVRGITRTSKRDQADLLVEITAREVVDGTCRVHVHVTTRTGEVVDLVGAAGSKQSGRLTVWSGTSEAGWDDAAYEIAHQLGAWAKAHPPEVTVICSTIGPMKVPS